MAAVMVALVANSTPVSFGTVGIPTVIGIGTSLNTPSILSTLSEKGISFSEFMHRYWRVDRNPAFYPGYYHATVNSYITHPIFWRKKEH